MGLLRKELLIRKGELEEQLFFASLERIFIEERMYKEKRFEQAADQKAVLKFLDEQFAPYKEKFIRPVTDDDYLRLLEIKMQRILKYNKDKADKLMAAIKAEIKGIAHDLNHMTDVTIAWYEHLLQTYGAAHPRLTEIRSFDTIDTAKVAEANEKLYINRQDGFIGTGLKKDEFVRIIETELRKIVNEGIDEKKLTSAINYSEFKYREQDSGRYPAGLILGINMYTSWLYDDNLVFCDCI